MEYLTSIWLWLGKYSAEIIALSALVFTAYQAYLSRTHNKISVKPHLVRFVTRNKRNSDGDLIFTLMNNGLGPAVIRSWKLMLDGSQLESSDEQSRDDVIFSLLEGIDFNHSITTLGDDYVMPANEKKNILAVQFQLSNGITFKEVESRLNGLNLIVEYASMYDDQFILDTSK